MIARALKTLLLAAAAFLLPVLLLELYFLIVPFESYQTNDPYQYTERIGEFRHLEPNHTYAERYPEKFDIRGYYYEKDDGLISYHFDRFGARWTEEVGQGVSENAVVALGDSFTFGFGLRYEDAYLYLTQQRLRSANLNVSIFNFAKPRAHSEKVLEIYHEVKDRVPHRLVLYGLHINDLIVFKTSFATDNSLLSLPLLRHSHVARFVLQRIHHLSYRDSSIAYLNDPARFREPFFHRGLRAITALHEVATSSGRDFRLVLLPLLVDLEQLTFAPLYQRLRTEFDKQGLPYIHLTEAIATGRSG